MCDCNIAKILEIAASLCSSREPKIPALNKTLVKPILYDSASILTESRMDCVAFLAAFLSATPLQAAGFKIL